MSKKKMIEDNDNYYKNDLNNAEDNSNEYSIHKKTTKYQLISVSEALRRNFGSWSVKGTIIGISKLFKMISKVEFYCDYCSKLTELYFPLPEFNYKNIDRKCDTCHKATKNELIPQYKNAVIVELQDIETFNDMDRLPIFLFDRDTEGIKVGETVIITGNIQVIEGKRFFAYIYGESVEYLNREDFTLSRLDIEAIKKFARNNFSKKYEGAVIEKLVSMFDGSIIGYDHIKKGLLMSAVNTSENTSKKEKIHVLLIGNPGLAKSQLLARITKLVTNSCHVSAQNASGKSLLAIIDKTDENTFLRLGPVPQARDAICGLNEIGRMSLEDQVPLLDVMEEGEFTKTAYGFHTRIKSPTTIIASANPVNNSRWVDDYKIDLNEFPILGPIKDRFDLKFVFRDLKTPEEIEYFADKLSRVIEKKEKGQLPDYGPFLMKYIQYARQLNPTLDDDANLMLRDFYKKISINKFGSPRVLITLHKLAKAIARLKAKETVDEEDAKEVMEFYNVMLLDFQKQVVIIQSSKEVAYQECLSILRELNIGIGLEELITRACQRNEQLKNYFEYGKKSLKIENNKKVRRVYEMLLNHSRVKRVRERPIVLQWLSHLSDLSDLTKNSENKYVSRNGNLSDPTDLSDLCYDTKKVKENIDYSTSNNAFFPFDISNLDNKDVDNGSVGNSTNNSSNENENNQTSTSKLWSERSDMSDIQLSTHLYNCNYCDSEFLTEKEHLKHCINSHEKRPAQPDSEIIQVMKEHGENVELKGNPWE